MIVDPQKGIKGQRVVWGQALEGSAQQLLSEIEQPEVEEDSPVLDAAEQWLAAMLGTGEVRVAFIKDMATQAGHAWRTVQRAKRSLGVVAQKAGIEAGWVWSLPKSATFSEERQHKNSLASFEQFEERQANCVLASFGGDLAPFDKQRGKP